MSATDTFDTTFDETPYATPAVPAAPIVPADNAPVARQAIMPVGKVDLATASFESMKALAGVLVRSGFYKDVTDPYKAVAKLLLGQELGLTMYECLTGIRMVEGKIEMAPALMAARINRSAQYSYAMPRNDNGADPDATCEIVIYEGKVRKPEFEIGRTTFSQSDAVTAGLASKTNWRSYPRNMRFARAMSNAAKWYCGDIFGGGAVYVEDEIENPAGFLNAASPPAPVVAAAPAVAAMAIVEDPDRQAKLQAANALASSLRIPPARFALDLEAVGGDVAALIASYEAKKSQARPARGRTAAAETPPAIATTETPAEPEAAALAPATAVEPEAPAPIAGEVQTAADYDDVSHPQNDGVRKAVRVFEGTPFAKREDRLTFAARALGWDAALATFNDLDEGDLKAVVAALHGEMKRVRDGLARVKSSAAAVQPVSELQAKVDAKDGRNAAPADATLPRVNDSGDWCACGAPAGKRHMRDCPEA